MGVLLLVAGDTREGDDGEGGVEPEVVPLTASLQVQDAEPTPADVSANDHAGPESAPARRAGISPPAVGMGEVRSHTLFKRIGRLKALGATNRNPRETVGFPTMHIVAPSITPPAARPPRVVPSMRSADDGIRALHGQALVREQQLVLSARAPRSR